MFLNDLEAYVRIDSDEVVNFVKDNKEFFMRELGVEDQNGKLLSLERKIQNLLDTHDSIRRDRDYNHADNQAVKLYEDLVTLKNSVRELMND